MSEFDTNDDGWRDDPSSVPEVDDADALEQDRRIDVGTNGDPGDLPEDVNPADAIDQLRETGMDDDEYDY